VSTIKMRPVESATNYQLESIIEFSSIA